MWNAVPAAAPAVQAAPHAFGFPEGWGNWPPATSQSPPSINQQMFNAMSSFNPLMAQPAQGSLGMSAMAGTMTSSSSAAHTMQNVVLTQQQAAEEDDEPKRYTGRIRKFQGLSGGHGYGFIDCPEIRHRTGLDVYLHAKQSRGCQVGEEVSFTVVFNTKGEPQARNMVRAEELEHLKKKKKKDAMKQQELLSQKRGGSLMLASTVMDEQQAKQFQMSLKRLKRE
jgi:hypothetical protein